MSDTPQTTRDFCLRDEFGFCRIGLIGGACPAALGQLKCFESEDEARAALFRAVEKAIKR